MDMWVFGYGSLLWNPGFEVAEQVLARMPDYHRSFCMRSIHHRGTPENPGLVLALEEKRGASCNGVALRVAAGSEEATLAYLRERELVSSAYIEKTLAVDLVDGRNLSAVTYVIDANHDQNCSGLPLSEQAEIIARAIGGRGPNSEYLFNTATLLAEMGIHDPDLDWLAARVTEILANSS